ncbi:hypothetical protein Pyn_08073 [Prunus yedoensis var. nudiflora]|uniref:Uncharacterized protein n=1 Tax=Prunus yedoensis var. nudiflora TaxID=2094558 RepID=A0A314V103_PRUYE|nr:hypothetical protein Pyn_08073 [Prunus yedoensis var. nudiflora]
MMINPDHSCNVTYIINNQLQFFMNYSVVLQIMPAASNSTTSYSSCYNHHHIFAFTIPTLLTLVQMRYPAVDLFQTHPTALTILLSGLVAYCFAFSFGDHANKWSRKTMLVFGSLSVASLLWILFFPHSSSYLTLSFLLLLVAVLGFDRLIRKLWQSIHQELRVAQNRISRRACPLLPMTSMNVSHRQTLWSSVILSRLD